MWKTCFDDSVFNPTLIALITEQINTNIAAKKGTTRKLIYDVFWLPYAIIMSASGMKHNGDQ